MGTSPPGRAFFFAWTPENLGVRPAEIQDRHKVGFSHFIEFGQISGTPDFSARAFIELSKSPDPQAALAPSGPNIFPSPAKYEGRIRVHL